MSTGIQVWGTAANILIDTRMNNVQLVQKGTINVDIADYDGTLPHGPITYQGPGSPFILFGQCSTEVTLRRHVASGDNHQFYVYANGPATLTYYIFAERFPSLGSNFGIQLFSETSDLLFDITSKPLRLAGLYNKNGQPDSWYTPYTMPAGKAYAANFSNTILGMTQATAEVAADDLGSGVRIDGNQIYMGHPVYLETTSVYGTNVVSAESEYVWLWQNVPSQILIADVTNF